MRVIGGRYRSRPLHSLPGLNLRPTADRLREALFNVLTAGNPEAFAGVVWIDLFAGTGAVGIEALSRGAAMVYFVESAGRAVELIRKNLRSLGVEAGVQVRKLDSVRAIATLAADGVQADFVFLDPPYRMETTYRQTLEALSRSPLLKRGAIVIVEHQKKFDPGEQVASLQRYRWLKQSHAALSFYRRS